MQYQVIIIGGGASGLAAAASLPKGISKALLEGNKKLGKKLLATGNGRCNLSNNNIDENKYHGDVSFLKPQLQSMQASFVTSFFESLGVLTMSDSEGRVYPLNQQAQAVNDALIRKLNENNTDIYLETIALKIKKIKGGFSILCSNDLELKCRKIIFASGGKASPKLSCLNESYSILNSLGHSITFLSPSIVQLKSSETLLKNLQGVRAKALVSLFIGDEKIRQEQGEVQFTEKALSGICVMQLSSSLQGFTDNDNKLIKPSYIKLDLMPSYSFSELFDILKGICCNITKLPSYDLLSGILNIKLGTEIIKKAGISKEKTASMLSDKELKAIVSLIKGLKITVTGLNGFEDAQVTAGGVPLKEVDLNTMESKLVKGLYFAGEVLNIHGDCGGYNLHFAFSTGIRAARNI